MGIEFDAAELDRVFAAELIRGEKVNMPYPLRYKAALLAVAAHVREQTLREAAGVCEENFASVCKWALIKLANEAASARETGGKK